MVALLGVVLGGVAMAQSSTDIPGVSVKVGGGIEGYTGDLDLLSDPGPTWGVSVAARPSSILSVEVAYSGATAEADDRFAGLGTDGLTDGPDIVRNGGQAALILGTRTAIQPYVLAGLGFDYYSVRGEGVTQYDSDASGSIPMGAGIRSNAGRFTADLRMTYSALFSDTFAGQVNTGFTDGRYAGTLHVGGNF